jgi:molybdopterin-guanine dinucleotide biosynthesis protein A
MGRSKALLPWRGTNLISHVVSQFSDWVDQVLVVSSRSLALPKLPAKIVVDEEEYRGPLAGITQGLEAMEADFAFVVSTDMPFVSEKFVKTLLSRRTTVAAEIGGFVQTLAAVYPKEGAEVARNLLNSGRLRPYDLLEELQAQLVKETELGFYPNLTGMNTPDSYLRAVLEDDPTSQASVEFFGRVRLSTGLHVQTFPVATLGKLLEESAPEIRWSKDGILSREYLISLDAREFVRDTRIPIGPGERIIVLDAPAGG